MTNEILKLLAQFGNNIENSPDVVPAFGNYFQDAGVGGSLIGNLTIVNGERLYPNGNTSEYPDFTFEWYNDGQLMTTKHHPTVADIVRPDYDGVVEIKVMIKHLPTSTIYERTQWAFFDMLGVSPTLEGNGRPLRWEVFYNFYPDEKFGRLEMDKDGDGLVSTTDLLDLISETPSVKLKAGSFIEDKKYSDEDWAKVPKEVMWLCTSKEGKVEMWSHKTIVGSDKDWVAEGKANVVEGFIEYNANITPYAGDWKDSLEKRRT